MNFTKTILEGIKYWVDKKFAKVQSDIAKVQSDIESKQPIGDYALKEDIPEINYPVTSVNKQTGDVDLNWDNLSDKPFSEFIPEAIISDVVITSANMYLTANPLLPDKEYTFIVDGVSHVRKMTAYNTTTSIVSVPCNDGMMTIMCNISNGSYQIMEATRGTTLTILDGVKEIIQLDEKFIPDTIARVEDIQVTSVNGQTGDVVIEIPEVTEQVQSDWEQSDENAVDFIKNKPDFNSLEAEVAQKSQVQIITWEADD
jgi:hypothetical protein